MSCVIEMDGKYLKVEGSEPQKPREGAGIWENVKYGFQLWRGQGRYVYGTDNQNEATLFEKEDKGNMFYLRVSEGNYEGYYLTYCTFLRSIYVISSGISNCYNTAKFVNDQGVMSATKEGKGGTQYLCNTITDDSYSVNANDTMVTLVMSNFIIIRKKALRKIQMMI